MAIGIIGCFCRRGLHKTIFFLLFSKKIKYHVPLLLIHKR